MEQESRESSRVEQRLRYKQAAERAKTHAEQRRAEQSHPPAVVEEQATEDHSAARTAPLPSASPLALDAVRILDVTAPALPEIRHPPLILAPVAGLAWGGVILLLIFGELSPASAIEQRVLYGVLLLIAGLLTFAPLQWALRLPWLTWRGVVGWGALFYTLAFVPAPTAWLLSLPDLPVYLILFMAVFLAVDAAAIPIIYALGLRIYHHRPVRYDVQRAARQAAEVGLFATGAVALASIEALTIISLLLLLAILGIIEVFILGGRDVQL